MEYVQVLVSSFVPNNFVGMIRQGFYIFYILNIFILNNKIYYQDAFLLPKSGTLI